MKAKVLYEPKKEYEVYARAMHFRSKIIRRENVQKFIAFACSDKTGKNKMKSENKAQ